MRKDPTYVIYAPSYNDNDGGCMVLHQLCHELTRMGETAYLWPVLWPIKNVIKMRKRTKIKNMLFPRKYMTNPALDTQVYENKKLPENAIVLYGEMIRGNPLGADRVARWLLHKPGFHTGMYEFTEGELLFKWDDYCDIDELADRRVDLLSIFTINSNYVNKNLPSRNGSCFLVRKGKNKKITHDEQKSKKIDKLPHSEIADIMNRSERFYSYDEDTMYSIFAALCGCDSIVIPGRYASRDDWVAEHPLFRYGVAYGEDDVQHARDTAHLVPGYMEELTRERNKTVHAFIKRTREHFGFDAARAQAGI